MPIRVNTAVTTGGSSVESPFVGPIDYTVSIPVTVAGLTTGEIDQNGFIKVGTPLLRTGLKVTAGAVYGCVYESTRVANTGSAADIAAAVPATPQVTVVTHGAVNRAILEDNLGRALTAAEIAGFALAGSLIRLVE